MLKRSHSIIGAAVAVTLSLAAITLNIGYVTAISRAVTNPALGADLPNPPKPEIEHAEETEIDQSQGVRSLDDEIANHEILDLGRQEDFFLANKGKKCDVLMEDVIDVALEPRDMLKTQQFIGSITPAELRLYLPDRLKSGEKPGKLFARFSLGAIVTPLETVNSSRDCFRMFYKKQPILFCAKDTNHRNFWMHTIVKAKFCHTAHAVLSKASTPDEHAEPAKLPDLSTKQKRLKDLLYPKSVSEDAIVAPHHDNNITNIDIKGVGSGEPEIYLNGEVVEKQNKNKQPKELSKEQNETRVESALVS
ncbi:putative integral membrane protein [Babesia bovis T2Bo]|uniref:putative integral membrane protein n=1 Tax=Babesia bovis T2Bo TaxID=484906 RepID=UPI001C35F3D7|nr:putative integral membrane protein [Babesia bovis T2Bo]EDO06044.2 putative integral membrane protein [Babesia bovis T2Bo]